MCEVVHADNDPVVEQWRQATAAITRVEALATAWACGGPWSDNPDLNQITWRVLDTAASQIRKALDGEEK